MLVWYACCLKLSTDQLHMQIKGIYKLENRNNQRTKEEHEQALMIIKAANYLILNKNEILSRSVKKKEKKRKEVFVIWINCLKFNACLPIKNICIILYIYLHNKLNENNVIFFSKEISFHIS